MFPGIYGVPWQVIGFFVVLAILFFVAKYFFYGFLNGANFCHYTILLKGRFFAIRFRGKYRRDLETGNWHYYEDIKGKIWHFRKDNILGVYGDTPVSVLLNKVRKK